MGGKFFKHNRYIDRLVQAALLCAAVSLAFGNGLSPWILQGNSGVNGAVELEEMPVEETPGESPASPELIELVGFTWQRIGTELKLRQLCWRGCKSKSYCKRSSNMRRLSDQSGLLAVRDRCGACLRC